MDRLIDLLTQFDFQHFISLIVIVWYFTRDIKKSLEEKIDKLDQDLRNEIHHLDENLKTMNTRISRVEGTVYGKEIYNHLENSK